MKILLYNWCSEKNFYRIVVVNTTIWLILLSSGYVFFVMLIH